MKTAIYKTYSDFYDREDKKLNGVSESFAADHPDYEKENASNEACWNLTRCSDCSDCSGCSRCSGCSGCSDCSDCSGCSRCSDCSGCSNIAWLRDRKNLRPVEAEVAPGAPSPGGMDVPIIPGVHRAILAAASQPDALNMKTWHTCETTHCRAGWVVHLAGERGRQLEARTSTVFAAMQILKASSPIRVMPVRFYETNEVAMADMKRCAAEEAALPAPASP